jgi:uncharacterized membrane protein
MNKQEQITSALVSKRIKLFEEQTGFELIVAATKSSDPYPGAQWRGGLLLGLLVSALLLHFYAFEPRSLEVLLIGLIISLTVAGVKLSGLGRFFVLPSESERETWEKAQVLFSQFQSTKLGHEAAIMLFISLEEHKMHLLIDRALNEKISEQDLHEILSLLRVHFKAGQFDHGLEKAIGLLEEKVLLRVGKNPTPPQLSLEDRIFWF